MHRHVAILLEVVEGTFGRVDRKMREVRPAKALQLGVEIGEVATLQKRVIREVDTGRHILRHERHLFGLGKEIVGHPVKDQSPDRQRLDHFLGNDLGRIKHVEVEAIGELLVEQLNAQLPFRETAGLDRLPQIAAVKVRIGAVDLDGLVPDHRLHAKLRLPNEFDECGFVLRVHEPERVDAEALHETERARDGPVRHHPHDHMHAFRRQTDEIPEIVMCGLGLGEASVGLRLYRMNEVREPDGVLDEENRDVVADDVPVAFLGIELDGKPAHVTSEVERPLASRHGRKADEGWRLFPHALENVRPCIFGERVVGLEIAVCPVASRMNHALGDALVVEVEQLLPEMEVLDQVWPTLADPKCIVVIGNRPTLSSGQDRRLALGNLVEFATIATDDGLVMNPGCGGS